MTQIPFNYIILTFMSTYIRITKIGTSDYKETTSANDTASSYQFVDRLDSMLSIVFCFNTFCYTVFLGLRVQCFGENK